MADSGPTTPECIALIKALMKLGDGMQMDDVLNAHATVIANLIGAYDGVTEPERMATSITIAEHIINLTGRVIAANNGEDVGMTHSITDDRNKMT